MNITKHEDFNSTTYYVDNVVTDILIPNNCIKPYYLLNDRVVININKIQKFYSASGKFLFTKDQPTNLMDQQYNNTSVNTIIDCVQNLFDVIGCIDGKIFQLDKQVSLTTNKKDTDTWNTTDIKNIDSIGISLSSYKEISINLTEANLSDSFNYGHHLTYTSQISTNDNDHIFINGTGMAYWKLTNKNINKLLTSILTK